MSKKKKDKRIDTEIDEAIRVLVEHVDLLTPEEVDVLRKVLDTREVAR